MNYAKTTQEAIEAGMGIIDGGATRTLSSVFALEKLMACNVAKYGRDGVMEIDVNDRPTFGFGNPSKDTCISTAKIENGANDKPGELKIQALDKGTGPILSCQLTL